ncbi:hypothetical protein EDC01DRAFT_682993 [Geopyxis carbonaria]|nr:hypothetical protein EDC01DRAFT_682993 [Geopyxis carbonaria]
MCCLVNIICVPVSHTLLWLVGSHTRSVVVVLLLDGVSECARPFAWYFKRSLAEKTPGDGWKRRAGRVFGRRRRACTGCLHQSGRVPMSSYLPMATATKST